MNILEDIRYQKGWLSLSGTLYQVEGADATSFLQGQTTNEVQKLGIGEGHINALLDISARVINFFLLFKKDKNSFALFFFKDEKAGLERLQKYLIMEEVDITAHKDEELSVSFFPQEETYSLDNFFGENLWCKFTKEKNSEFPEELKINLGLESSLMSLGDIFNTSPLFSCAYNKDKGCFLGQEVVSKIESGRGAATQNAFLKVKKNNALEGALFFKEKKVAQILKSYPDKILVKLNREFLIQGREYNFTDHLGKEIAVQVELFPFYEDLGRESRAHRCYLQGVSAFVEKENEKAKFLFDLSLELNPQHVDTYEALGVWHAHKKEWDLALNYMDQVLELNPRSIMAHTNKSLYYMNLGQIEKAEEEKALATLQTFENAGEESHLQEQEKQAQEERKRKEKMFLQVLKIDPEDHLAHYSLGDIYYQEKNYSLALKHLEKSLECDSRHSVSYHLLALTYLSLKKDAEAKKLLEKGLAVAAKNGDLVPANKMQKMLLEITST